MRPGFVRGLVGPRAVAARAQPFPTAPDQPQTRYPVGDVAWPGADQSLDRGGEHPTTGARTGALVGSDHMRHSAAEGVRLDPVDREATQIEQERPIQYRIRLNMLDVRILRQVRGLTLIRKLL